MVQAWCRHASSHYLNKCWPRSYKVTGPHCAYAFGQNIANLSESICINKSVTCWVEFPSNGVPGGVHLTLWRFMSWELLHTYHDWCDYVRRFCWQLVMTRPGSVLHHDDVIKWKRFPRYWPFVRGIHRSPVNSLHKGQWRGALMFSLICAWINRWINNCEAGDLRRHCAHYDAIVMRTLCVTSTFFTASHIS